MKINELHNQPVEADTYEASMALNQLLKIGKHAIKIHNMIDDSAEMEAWVAKKIDLAGDYVKKVHGYMQGEKAGLYDDGGLTENVRYPNPSGKVVKKFATDNPDTKFVLSQNPNGKFRVTYNMDVNIGGLAKTGAQTMTVNGATGEFDNANDAIAAGKKDAADYYKDELAKSKQPLQPDPPFNLEDWSTDKVQEFGGDLIRLAKGQSIEMGGYDSYGYELDDGRPDDDDDEGNEAATDSIGGEVTSAIKMHRDYIDNMYYDKQVDPDKVKPNKETIEYAQAIIRKPEFKKAYQSTESLEARLEAKLSEDAGSLTDQQKKGLTLLAKKYSGRKGVNGDPLIRGWITARTDSGVTSDGWDSQEVEAWEKKTGKDLSDWSPEDDKQFINQNEISRDMEDELLRVMGDDEFFNKPVAGEVLDFIDDLTGPVSEDAGEGHMSKSTLYHTAKYAIELMDMIKQGDDLEGWVQSKLNKAADYLQGVHNYEEYQKLNPYREELDSELLQRHAGIIQKNIDEILARETSLDDVDTKPGMMRILAKRVNEVEKEIAKEQRKDTDEEAPPGREKQVKALKKKFKDKGAPYAIAWAQHNKHGKPKKEAELEEGLKDWAKKTAMAGVIVAGLAGIGSISDAIDNSIPAISAMETALEMAEKSGNDELAKMIEKDLSDAKIRLSSGKDLSHVTDLQNKYAKFIKTEGLAYESKLAVSLNQRLK